MARLGEEGGPEQLASGVVEVQLQGGGGGGVGGQGDVLSEGLVAVTRGHPLRVWGLRFRVQGAGCRGSVGDTLCRGDAGGWGEKEFLASPNPVSQTLNPEP